MPMYDIFLNVRSSKQKGLDHDALKHIFIKYPFRDRPPLAITVDPNSSCPYQA